MKQSMTQDEFVRVYLTADEKTKQAVNDLLATQQESGKRWHNSALGADKAQTAADKGVW